MSCGTGTVLFVRNGANDMEGFTLAYGPNENCEHHGKPDFETEWEAHVIREVQLAMEEYLRHTVYTPASHEVAAEHRRTYIETLNPVIKDLVRVWATVANMRRYKDVDVCLRMQEVASLELCKADEEDDHKVIEAAVESLNASMKACLEMFDEKWLDFIKYMHPIVGTDRGVEMYCAGTLPYVSSVFRMCLN